jgi:hypothetical protein
MITIRRIKENSPPREAVSSGTELPLKLSMYIFFLKGFVWRVMTAVFWIFPLLKWHLINNPKVGS